jgi:hypothetical protein
MTLRNIGYTDNLNGTVAPLTSGSSWTGTWVTCEHFSSVVVACKTDQPGTLTVQFSPDKTNIDSELNFDVAAGVNEVHRITVSRLYYRAKFTNDTSGNQTYLRLSTLLSHGTQLNAPLNATIQSDSDALVTRSVSSEIDIAAGRVAGLSIVNKFGRNIDIDTGAAEDIWGGGGSYTGFATLAETLSFVSTSAADASAGTGARTIRIIGLDANYNQIQETVTLNGLTPVTTTQSFLRAHTMATQTAGSGGVNAGTITVTQSVTTANVMLTMEVGTNQSYSSGYTVPAGYTAYLRTLTGAIRGASSATAFGDIWTRAFGGVFRARRPFVLSNGNTLQDQIYGGLVFTEKADLVLRITSVSSNNTEVTGGYDLILVQNQ